MRVPGFARKFWTMTSCTCPCSSPSAFSASSASIRSSRVSPMPMRIPLVNGIASSPASRIVSRRLAGTLSGDAQCGPPFAESRSAVVSSMIPIDAETGRRRLELSAGHDTGVQVRQQARLREDEPRAALEVLERRRAPQRVQLLARDLVAQLGLVAEREERLAASRRRARPRDREHLVLGHERAFAATRWARERAVAADVATERRQRDEHLRRVRDERSRAEPPGLREQLLERRGADVGESARHRTSIRRWQVPTDETGRRANPAACPSPRGPSYEATFAQSAYALTSQAPANAVVSCPTTRQLVELNGKFATIASWSG